MKLLSLDCGLTTGFALVERGEPPITGSIDFPGNSTDKLGLLGVRFGHWLKDFLASSQADGLVLCVPYISPKFTNMPVTKVLFAMFGIAKTVCWTASVPVYELMEPRVRRAMGVKAGHGRKNTKAGVLQACRDRRWYVTDDHAGDALLAAAYQLGILQPMAAIESQPLFVAAQRKRKKCKGRSVKLKLNAVSEKTSAT